MEKTRLKLNLQAILECICFAGFAALLVYLLLSQKYLEYIALRMQPYLIFAVIVLLLWAVVVATRIFQPQYQMRAAHCLVLILPAMLFLLPHTTAINSTASDRLVFTATNQQVAEDTLVQSTGIVIGEDDFYQGIVEMYNQMDSIVGEEISIKGYILVDPDLGASRFVIARQVMSCCVADVAPMGIICQYDQVYDLDEGGWVIIKGKVVMGEYEGHDDPQVLVEEIVPSTKPSEEYVYPGYWSVS